MRTGHAKTAEHGRDGAIRMDGRYDTASALSQIGLVVASAAMITGAAVLVWAGAALGGAGAVLIRHGGQAVAAPGGLRR